MKLKLVHIYIWYWIIQQKMWYFYIQKTKILHFSLTWLKFFFKNVQKCLLAFLWIFLNFIQLKVKKIVNLRFQLDGRITTDEYFCDKKILTDDEPKASSSFSYAYAEDRYKID